MTGPVYDKHTLPKGDWQEYRKIGITSMIPVSGPLVVVTLEGEYSLPAGWRGYIAVDTNGCPYPIDEAMHAKSYVQI